MSQTTKSLTKRIMAVALTVLMLMTMVPAGMLQSGALVEAYFTVIATDGTDPVADATVTLKNGGDEWSLYLQSETDETGVAKFDVHAIAEALAEAELTSANVIIETKAEGFVDSSKPVSVSTDDALAKNVTVTLEKEIPVIPDSDYVINGYSGAYDGNAHGAYVKAEGCTVRYSEDGTIFTENEITITNTGKKKVYVELSKEGYKSVTKEVTLEVVRADRTDFKFGNPNPADIIYKNGHTFNNFASSSQEPQEITYKSSDGTIASVYSSGKVKVLKAGTVTITATMPASENYNESVISYTVTIKTAEREGFTFTTTQPSDITYGDNENKFTNAIENAEGLITYSIKSQTRDGVAVEDVASIDPSTGELTITGSGTVVVTATAAADDYYGASTAEYTLNINKAKQTDFKFTEENPENIKYNKTYKNEATGGESTGEITYEIVTDPEAAEPVKPVVELVANAEGKFDGTIKAVGVGKATIKATKAADSKYEAAEVTYEITVIKADQTGFAFLSNPYNVFYGTEELVVGVTTAPVVDEKAEEEEETEGAEAVNEEEKTEPEQPVIELSTGEVTYSIKEDSVGIAAIDAKTGKLTFVSGKTGEFTIKAVKAGDDNYNEVSAETVVKVTRADLSGNYVISSGGVGENGWYIGNIEIIPSEGYVISYSDAFDAEWKEKLVFEEEGEHEIPAFYLKKLADGADKGAISDVFSVGGYKLDKTNPAVPELTYSKSFQDVLFENITFGFYDADVTVDVTASDAVSGIDRMVYDLGDGEKEIENVENGKGSFTVPPQFNGKVSVEVFDEAGNSSSVNGERILIVDTIAPEVTVAFDPQDDEAANTRYFKKNRTVIVTVKEANFYNSDVEIFIEKRLNDEAEYSAVAVDAKFLPVEGQADTYQWIYTFDENADYTFDISYTDKSGNTYDSFDKKEFVIDKFSPAIKSDVIDGNYYLDNTVINFEIKEHNFDAKDVELDISAVDITGALIDIDAEAFKAYLKDNENWDPVEGEADTYVASITLTEEGRYNLGMTYNDLAGIAQAEAIDASFILDKTDPQDLTISYSEPITEVIKEFLTLGYYNAEAEVTVSATDNISGIALIDCEYTVNEGVSSKNEGGKASFEIDAANTSATVEKSFRIPAQFNGKVEFTAVDYAKRTSKYRDVNRDIIADSVAPNVDVEFNAPSDSSEEIYDGETVEFKYYDKKAVVTVIVEEANFYADEVAVKVLKRGVGETAFTEIPVVLAFEPLTKDDVVVEDTYTATYEFVDAGDYVFDISYTDKSGNVYDSYDEYYFTVDTVAPVINVEYNNNSVSNEKYFNADRTATIEIVEHNFDASRVDVAVTGKEVPAIVAELTKAESWKAVEGKADTYVAQIPYTVDSEYTFAISVTDKAGNKNEGVNYAEGTAAPESFVIDKVDPTVSILATNGDWSKEWTGADSFENRSFALTFNDTETKLTIKNADDFSGIDYVEGFLSNSILTLDAVKASDKWNKLTLAEDNTFVYEATKESRFVMYAHIVDKAGNEAYVSSDGIIIDFSAANIEREAPVVSIETAKPSEDGIYNADVTFDVTAYDPIVEGNGNTDMDATFTGFSGLASITYTITSEALGKKVEGTLFSYTNNAPKAEDLVQKLSTEGADAALQKIVAEAAAFNANDVVVTVYVADRAGNKSEASTTVKIDTTPAKINVDFDNDSADSDSFFKADRIATVTVTERNFDPADFVWTITNSDGDAPVATEWTVTNEGTGNGDDTVHTAKVSFTADGDYTFAVAYDKDMADNESEAVTTAEGTVAPWAFTIDKTAPVVEVSYDNNNVLNDIYFKAARTATITITEHNFDADRAKVILTAKDHGNDIECPVVTEWFTDGDKHTATVTFDKDGEYTLKVKVTDKAGNVNGKIETGDSAAPFEFVLDFTLPVVSIKYNNNNARNEKYFKADREATITIVEYNFDAKDVAASLVVKNAQLSSRSIDVTTKINEVLAELREKDSWTEIAEDTYEATLKYSIEADYEFGFGYADLAGNVNDGIIEAEGTVAPWEFTLDKTRPTTDVTIGNSDWSRTWSTFPVSKNAADYFERSFTLADNKAVTIKLENGDNLSGIEYVEYIKTDKILSLDAVKAMTWTKASLKSDGTFSFKVDPAKGDERFVVYTHIVDMAGNEWYVSSDGITVDDTLPNIERVAPVVTITPAQPSAAGIYNKDVLVDLDVADPVNNGIYSGIKSVTYKIYNMGTMTAQGTLYTFTKEKPVEKDFVQFLSTTKANGSLKLSQILVASAQNNSNDVKVEVTVTDNAGNVTTKSCSMMIDITAPTIAVSFDNNSADSDTYFKAERTATIVITERNFNADDINWTLTNTDGSAPSVSSWTKVAGSGNGDSTTWTATVPFTTDGDYTFNLAYTDLANNKASGVTYASGTVAANSFTIDKTNPVITVSYDNNSAQNGNYYKDTRTATITINEHNLEPNGTDSSRVVITMTANDDGQSVTLPTVSSWSTSGDNHVATVNFDKDALYTFDIAVTDKAGNASSDYTQDSFYVDLKNPALTITGVANNSANKGDVIPVVTYSDTNLDTNQISITLTGANRKSVKLDGTYTSITNGQIFTFKNFAKTKEVDDIYTLTALLTDKAGRTSLQTIVFSVNRFGSTYVLSDATKELNGTYVQEPINVVVTEINPDALSDIKVTLFKDSKSVVLTEGTDYEIKLTGGNGKWYRYTYNVFAKNFAEDGVYSVTFQSNDKAGNAAKNDNDDKKARVNFGIDATLPIINIANLESYKTYPMDNYQVEMSIKDNLKLTKVFVELDGVVVREWAAEELDEIIKNGGNFVFDTPGDSKEAHNLIVYAVDAAGNGEKITETTVPANAEVVEEFYVTTNLWVRYFTNKPLFYGSIAGAIAVMGLAIFLIVSKKKKKESK